MMDQIVSAKLMGNIFLGVVAVVAILVLKEVLKAKPRRKINWDLYKKKEALFTAAERSFLGVLESTIGDQYKIFGKVRIADIAAVRGAADGKEWRAAQVRINEKHIDFVLCDKKDLSIVCAIELNDQSHERKKRRERDEFVENLCKTIGLPFLAIRAQRSYAVNEIRETIIEAMKSAEN